MSEEKSTRARVKPQGIRARAAAAQLLDSVLREGRTLEQALTRSPAFEGLEARDRALARRLVATTLRRLGQIDSLIGARLTAGRLPGRAEKVRAYLRLGAAEIAFLKTPIHAALHTAVALAGEGAETRPYGGLVNAVLRRLARDLEAEPNADALAPVSLNTPAWLFDRWVRAYGMEETLRLAAAHAQEPPLDITVKAEPALWAERLQARLLPSGTLRRAFGGRIEDLPGYEEGAWWIEDAAASFIARLLRPVAGLRALDLCAAPGGKSAWLALEGADVLAVDEDEERLARLKSNMARLKLKIRMTRADVASFHADETFSRVLLDAPCTATGTIRRHPDIAWLKRPEDVARLAALQERLLDAAVEALAPDGLFVYSVCSLEPEESLERIETILARHRELKRVPILPEEVGGTASFITPAGDLRTLPSHWPEWGGLDGFYAARVTRER
jgi:16S rRNA (cytosine967-C5)-methyltransferase